MKNWYCKPASEAEAIEIVRRAVANGVAVKEVVSGMGFCGCEFAWDIYSFWGVYDGKTMAHNAPDDVGEQLTIQQVREQFPLPHEVNDMSDKKEWQGPQDGLPPSGTECEFNYAEGVWYKVFIVGKDDCGNTVFTSDSFSELPYDSAENANLFRPLRTERERWADQAKLLSKPYFSPRKFAEVIYDALKSGSLKAPEAE